MGEVVVSSSSEEAEGVVVEFETEKKDIGSSEVVRWEEFLPRMVLSVLLVEADDSTRHIIADFLRKCSYRVAAVPDGLMAWETLKDGPHNIDLILTEVELPLISGYELLTLVMEHDVLKNIPVIMMSSHDSISMVLKCMLKGAADFLIKPVRKNELRNLWQHVWRRLTVCFTFKLVLFNFLGSTIVLDKSLKTCIKVRPQLKTTLQAMAQVCFTKRYIETACFTTSCAELLYDPLLGSRECSHANYEGTFTAERGVRRDAKLDKSPVTPENKTGERSNRMDSDGEPCSGAYNPIALRMLEEHACAKSAIQDEDSRPENARVLANSSFGCDDVPFESSIGVIDLIGTLNNGPKTTYVHSSLHYGTNKFEFIPQLELSLKRLYPSSSKNPGVDERYALNHPNASSLLWQITCTIVRQCNLLFQHLPVMVLIPRIKSLELSSSQHAQNINSIYQRHGATLNGNQDVTIPIMANPGRLNQHIIAPDMK
ncbi:hypothetical protein SADUNF_Sadunf14G0076800 [Salix dunnii]|uniref:Response regulatory domain-containing protein n=1 Tax=Salix dunnii TaxID=1413687 RepID=A0A835JDE4_9ROSI|nr:hypothetical protein SADUNF_Sadunf14G0076800 [Salix dunnii]